jgi:RNA polymerase sigma-70 factor (ECF subfamily)
MDDQTFESTLGAARAGSEWAWRDLYGEIAPPVLGFLRARGVADPDDLGAEVFVQIVRDLPRFEGDWRGFRAWVFAIARNRLLDERRRHARRPEVPLAEPAEVPQPVGDVAEEALAGLEIDRVAAILAELSPDQRDVVLLRVIGDLSIEEVARVVGKRTGAVKQLQRRGLAAARKVLEHEQARI